MSQTRDVQTIGVYAFADACGVTDRTVRRWRARGWIEQHGYTLDTGEALFDAADVPRMRAWVEARKGPAAGP